MITWMFSIGIYFAMSGLVSFIVGLSLAATHPVGFVNKRPTLPVKWFITCFALFVCSFSWMFSAM